MYVALNVQCAVPPGTLVNVAPRFKRLVRSAGVASTPVADPVAPYTVTYDGHAHSATVTSITGVNGETGATVGTVDVSNTAHIPAGTYSSDSWSFTGTANYNNIAATTITDTINKATAVVVVTPYSVTYDGNQHTATVASITGVNGETGATVGTVDVSNTTHTSAGTYSADSWTFTDPTGNYKNVAATTVTDQIDQATASVTVTPYHVTYDATAHTASGTATGVGGVNLSADLTLSGTTHTSAGTYSADSWTFTDPTGNYKNVAATTITDQIDQATASITVTPYHVTYDATAHTASGTATGVGGVNLSSDLDLSNTTHTSAGTYSADSWTFTDPTGNYKNVAATTITDQIDQATSKTAVTFEAGPYTYRGTAFTATAAVTGVGGLNQSVTVVYSGDCTNVTTANGCTTTANFAGDMNHTGSTDSKSITITQAPTTTAVSGGGTFTYNGLAHPATVLVTGAGGLSLTPPPVYTGACSAAPVNVPDTPCTASYSYAGDANHTGSTASTTINMTKTNQSITWNAPATMTYGGPLSSTQLNATVVGVAGGSAPGSLTYNPAAGTVLSVGPQTLTVTAAATANYNLALKTVQINVLYASGGICDGDIGHQILQPINAGNPGNSVFKQGSTVPAKFRVCDVNGNSIGTTGLITGFVLYQINSGTIAPIDETTDNSTNDLGWRFDPTGQQWIFNMSTKIAPANKANQTYYFRIDLNDGTSIYFNFGLK